MSRPRPIPQTILFSGHDLRFIRPFISHCERTPSYRVLLDQHPGHDITHTDKCRELLPSADVIFCEWCLGNAVWYSRHKLPRQRLLVRLHLQEIGLPYLDSVQWDHVDALILICPHNQALIHERYPFLKEKTRLIYNPVDCGVFDQPKLPGAEFNLGVMGICPMRKAPHLAFEIFARLKKADRRFTLFVKGKHPSDHDWLWRRPEERAYYEKFYCEIEQSPFADSVVFETYGDDVPLWFSKIGFILSTSDFEGSHQAVAEGMASGAIPIIRNWAGADLLYPAKYVVRTTDEAAAAVLKWRTAQRYEDETAFCRAYAREHFDQHGIRRQLEALFGNGTPGTDATGQSWQVERSRVMVLGYLPPGFRGGYRIRIEQEIKTLVRHGHCVHLACFHPPEHDSTALEAHRAELQALGCPVHLVPVAQFFDIQLDEAAVGEPLEALQRIAAANDLRLLHAEALYCARIGFLLKQRCPGLRLVFDCHGASPDEERMGGAHPARVSAMEQWERRVLAAADLNVFVSEAMNRFCLERYGFDTLPHVVVPCCVADERFPPQNAPCPLALPPRRPVVAYLGTLAAWQCGEEMIRLFAQLHRCDPKLFFHLLVPQTDHAKARALMTRHRLPDDAVLLAELPHDEVAAALQHAHVGVLLRRAHPVNQVSSPTKFGEYLAAGLPVLMTEGIGDFSRLAAENSLGLLLRPELLDAEECPEEELYRILAFVRSSREQRTRTAAHCRDFAREHLHWDAAITALARGYGKLDEIGVTRTTSENPSTTR